MPPEDSKFCKEHICINIIKDDVAEIKADMKGLVTKESLEAQIRSLQAQLARNDRLLYGMVGLLVLRFLLQAMGVGK